MIYWFSLSRHSLPVPTWTSVFLGPSAPTHGERVGDGEEGRVLHRELWRRGRRRRRGLSGCCGVETWTDYAEVRPIAPKPVPAVGAPPVAARATAEGRKAKRARRKAGGGGGGREDRRGRKARKVVIGAFKEGEREGRSPSSSESSAGFGSMVTLPLMPETPERKEAAPPAGVAAMPYVIPAWLRAR